MKTGDKVFVTPTWMNGRGFVAEYLETTCDGSTVWVKERSGHKSAHAACAIAPIEPGDPLAEKRDSAIATLDAITTKYAAKGKSVTIIGMNDNSAERHARLSGQLSGAH